MFSQVYLLKSSMWLYFILSISFHISLHEYIDILWFLIFNSIWAYLNSDQKIFLIEMAFVGRHCQENINTAQEEWADKIEEKEVVEAEQSKMAFQHNCINTIPNEHAKIIVCEKAVRAKGSIMNFLLFQYKMNILI